MRPVAVLATTPPGAAAPGAATRGPATRGVARPRTTGTGIDGVFCGAGDADPPDEDDEDPELEPDPELELPLDGAGALVDPPRGPAVEPVGVPRELCAPTVAGAASARPAPSTQAKRSGRVMMSSSAERRAWEGACQTPSAAVWSSGFPTSNFTASSRSPQCARAR